MARRLLTGIFGVTAGATVIFGATVAIARAIDKFQASKADETLEPIKKLEESGGEETPEQFREREYEEVAKLFLIFQRIANLEERDFEEIMERIMKFEESEAKDLEEFIKICKEIYYGEQS